MNSIHVRSCFNKTDHEVVLAFKENIIVFSKNIS
jgi:hypothetical protein